MGLGLFGAYKEYQMLLPIAHSATYNRHITDERAETMLKMPRLLAIALLLTGSTILLPTSEQSKASAQVNSTAMVNAHNQWRQQVGSPPLVWSNELAQVAQDWANQLVKKGRMEHRPNSQYGENIYWGRGRRASAKDVVDAWGSEVKDFRNGVFPDVSRTGNWADVGHYTQVVWKDTTEVGCGMARANDNAEYWVCNYNPPGNFQGRRPF
ncbi:CAP family protein [Roseofilum casamattae]|uniref:CAP family protein n=1 Tax=Roseofilum casamattae BLCC-M143 TaxID=3022442 RepID=A0ABT7BTR0_9CYAN|nr:CAP family protein [Roseofilum casamattae]MDJ1181881.1 CAP family protein [Roseofilum casamattae BLCC-M143]